MGTTSPITNMKTSDMAKLSFDEILAAGKVSESDTPALREIDCEKIRTNDANFYSVDDVKELADSIAVHGLLDPVVVTPEGDGFLLISGHRRFKAWQQLREQDAEKYARIPAIVRTFPSPQVAELALIMANSTSRKLTPAEIGKQAQRIETLLYELKEQGYAFPGRMREQVAKACQVSSTKLARLKMIRDNLTPAGAEMFEQNKLPEETAYQLARLSPEIQARILAVYPNANAKGVEVIGKLMAEGVTYDGTQVKNGCGNCRHGDAFLRHDLDDPNWACKGETCCLHCERATRNWNPCSRMCSAAKKVRAEENKAEKEKAEAEQKKRENKTRTELRECALRLVKAADAAGVSDRTEIKLGHGWRQFTMAWVRKAANGEDIGQIYSNELNPAVLDVGQVAKALQCSADYVCGLTEDLNPEPKKKEPGRDVSPWWQKGDPELEGRYLCLVDMNDSGYPDIHEQQLDWTGSEWRAYGRPVMDMFVVVGWYALPPQWAYAGRRPDEKEEDENV